MGKTPYLVANLPLAGSLSAPLDLHACREHIKIVLDAEPTVFNHNIETVERLSADIRSVATYRRTLEVLIERIDPLTEMYVGRAYMHAPDTVDGCVRFRGREHRPGEFAMVEITRTAGLNLIGKEIEHA